MDAFYRVDPVEAFVPVEPVEPVEPEEPLEPVEPVEAVEPVETGVGETGTIAWHTVQSSVDCSNISPLK